MEKLLGLYIHIPFCKAKCFYCDFNSYSGMDSYYDRYFKALYKEISVYSENAKDYTVDTIYIGGGTPSLVPSFYILKTLNIIRSKFRIEENAEISMESNPGTLDKEELYNYKQAGINRLSMGVQSMDNRLLKLLGRIHSSEEFLINYGNAREAGFENISIDLIFGLPTQTMNQWEETLLKITDIGPEHISCYSLKIEEDTKLEELVREKKLEEIDDSVERNMYYQAKNILSGKGYQHYEISNFAKPGRQSKHNKKYWKEMPYIGFGAGAHSFFNNTRFSNISDVLEYTNSIIDLGSAVKESIKIDYHEIMKEYVMLGFRLLEGINPEEFYKTFKADMRVIFEKELNKLCKKGLIRYEKGIYSLTDYGLDFANQVFIEFV